MRKAKVRKENETEFTTSNGKLVLGDCLDLLLTLEDNSIDAIVTDPPAGIGFMGKEWDRDKGGRDKWIAWMQGIAVECLRVLKPGGHALVWSIERTSHWIATAWENAGFEIRHKIYHAFGTGFPKSLDVGKAIDKMFGAEREVVGVSRRSQVASEGWDRPWKHEAMKASGGTVAEFPITAPATPEARKWDGWKSSLKPAVEEWHLLRKPIKGTIAANVLEFGTGALNVGACGIPHSEKPKTVTRTAKDDFFLGKKSITKPELHKPRYPSHLILSYPEDEFDADGNLLPNPGKDEVVGLFPVTKSSGGKNTNGHNGKMRMGCTSGQGSNAGGLGDSGSASRFFYCAKPSKRERGEYNSHPTVKSIKLMKYLITMITPPGGTVLDCFGGSGTTALACEELGFKWLLAEKERESWEIAKRRIEEKIGKNKQLRVV
jgi:DNA modification methylase